MPFGRRGRRQEPDLPVDWRAWRRVPPDRVGLAEDIESCEDFGVEQEARGRHRISLYDDLRALVGDDAIETLPEKVARLPGVTSCLHVDREEIEVEGPIRPEQLAAYVVAELAATADPHFWDEG